MLNLPHRIVRLVIVFIGITILYVIISLFPWQKMQQVITTQTGEVATTTKPLFTKPTLEARAAVVYDIQTKTVIYSNNGNTSLPLASITKLVTALTSSKILNSESQITITEQDLAEGSNAGLAAGHNWHYNDLLDVMMTTSSNGAAKAIARSSKETTGKDFITMMNTVTNDLGLNSMTFRNETGLDMNYGGPGATGSAIDVAKLISVIAKSKPELLSSTRLTSITKTTVDQSYFSGRNTNLIVQTIPGFIASKTGFTDLAGGNLVVVLDAGLNHPIAIVVLGSSQEGRFSDMEKLVQASLEYYAHQ